MKSVLTNHAFVLIAGALAVLMTIWLSSQIPQQITDMHFMDTYFGADVPCHFSNLTKRSALSVSSTKHPLFCLLLAPSYILQYVLPFSPWRAVQILLATNSFLWAVVIFQLCKRITGRGLHALLLTVLAMSTGSAIFWLPMPETFAFGSTTVLLPLTFLICSKSCKSYALHVLAHVLAMGVTLTNWSSAIVSSQVVFGTRKNALISLHALGILCLLMALLPIFVPKSGFINARVAINQRAKFANTQSLPITLQHVFLTSASPHLIEYRIIPQGKLSPRNDHPNIDVHRPLRASLDHVDPPSRMLQYLQYFIWLLLLGASAYQFLRFDRGNQLLAAVYLAFVAQFVVTLIYGRETFIYSLHWTPLLVISIGTLLSCRFRLVVMASVFVLTAANMWTNVCMFRDSMDILQRVLILPN